MGGGEGGGEDWREGQEATKGEWRGGYRSMNLARKPLSTEPAAAVLALGREGAWSRALAGAWCVWIHRSNVLGAGSIERSPPPAPGTQASAV